MSDGTRDDEVTIALHAEALEVSRRSVEGATVRVETLVHVRDAVVDEMLAREDVVIERVNIRQIVDVAPGVREEGDTIIIPVIEEVLVTERRLFLKEEVRIRRVKTTERYREVVALREEEAVVTRVLPALPFDEKTIPEGLPMMASETIVAVFDTPAHAELAIADLTKSGVPASAIEHFAQVDGDASGEVSTIETGKSHKGFWSWLTGEEGDQSISHHTVYDNSMASGHTVVTVVVDANRAEDVMSLLDEHDPIDIDAHSGLYDEGDVATETSSLSPVVNTVPVATAPVATMPAAAVPSTAAAGEQVISLSEETLQVGKRAVERGTTRVRRFVVERPVEEQIRLRDEHVSVFRRPVTGVAASVGADAFSEKIVEMTETGEEAVVGKTSHVVEEVVVKKEVGERVETIHDSLRREDVEIKETVTSVDPVARVPSDGLKPV